MKQLVVHISRLKFSRVFKFTFIFLLIPTLSFAESFIYIEKKPVLWIYPQDPVYQAWYKHADLIKLAKLMQDTGKEQMTLFAKTALHQMAILYEQVAINSRQEEGSTAGKNFKKSRWRHTAHKYAEQLRVISEQVDETSEIELYIEEYGEPTIVIDGKPYILTAPDLKKSGLLYTAIVEDLCKKEICIEENKHERVEKNKLRIVIKAEWKISKGEHPEFYSEDGLHFIFNDLQGRKKKQEISLQIMRELRLISDTLVEISTKGISIDWDALALERIAGSYGHKLVINRFGDSLALELIYLGRRNELMTQAIPWMQARTKSATYQQLFNDADKYVVIFSQ